MRAYYSLAFRAVLVSREDLEIHAIRQPIFLQEQFLRFFSLFGISVFPLDHRKKFYASKGENLAIGGLTPAVDVAQLDLVSIYDELAELALDGAFVVFLLLLVALLQKEELFG